MKLIDLAELSPRIGSTWIGTMAERLLGIDQLNRTYSFARSGADPEEFFARCIEELEVVDEIAGWIMDQDREIKFTAASDIPIGHKCSN